MAHQQPLAATKFEAGPLWDEARLAAVHTQPDKARRVRDMFNAIAPRYGLVNAVFSLGRDAAWRRRAVQLAAVQAGDAVLDIACGTGDFLRAFRRYAPQAGLCAGCDFAHAMLQAARRDGRSGMSWCEADGLRLPFADGSFDVTSCAFGVRNFQNLAAGLAEMHRVLRPRGRAVILEFTRPANRVVRAMHEFYAGRIMPLGATLLSGDTTGAYRYLPKSVVSFAQPQDVARQFQAAGFAAVAATPLTFGVVTVYVATKVSA